MQISLKFTSYMTSRRKYSCELINITDLIGLALPRVYSNCNKLVTNIKSSEKLLKRSNQTKNQ